MIGALLALALAAPLDLDQVQARAPGAIRLIEVCQTGTCSATDMELAEAYAVRAAHAAIDTGELDLMAANNIAALDPITAMLWGDVLPEPSGEPEEWVLRRLRGLEPEGQATRAKREPALLPDASGSSVAVGGGAVLAGPTVPAPYVAVVASGGVGGGFAMGFRGGVQTVRPNDELLDGFSVTARSVEVAGRVMLGHVWRAKGGASLGVNLGLAGGWSSFAQRSAQMMWNLGHRTGVNWNVGWGVGVAGAFPLSPSNRVAATVDSWFAQVSAPRSAGVVNHTLFPAGPLRSPAMDLGIRVRPGSDRLSLWAGTRYGIHPYSAHPHGQFVQSGLGLYTLVGWAG